MKMTRLIVGLVAVSAVAVSANLLAAPVESMESAQVSAAYQKVDAFLGEQAVVVQLTALGVSRQQVTARLSQLSETQMAQLAAQVDLIKAGGDIQGGNPNPLGPIGCALKQLSVLLKNFFRAAFCWHELDLA
jgi:hypothetical protein